MSGKLLSVLLLSGLAAPCAAQAFGDDESAGIEIAPARQVRFFANAHADAYSASSTRGRFGGELSSASLETSISAFIPVDDQTDLLITAKQTAIGYDFNEFRAFGGATTDAIDFGEAVGVEARVSRAIDREWSFFGGGEVSISGEIGADVDDSLLFSGFGGVRYQVHEDLAIGVALSARTELEDDTQIYPIPLVEWQIDDYWRLDVGGNTSSGNPGIEISHELNDNWHVGASLTAEQLQFRLEDDNSTLPGGVFEDFTIPLMFVATWSDSPNFEISGRVGSVVYRDISLVNSSGIEVGDTLLRPNFAFGLSGIYRF